MRQITPPQQEESLPPNSYLITRTASSFKNILMGILIGVLIGIAGLLFYQRNQPQIAQALYTATWVFFCIAILTFIIFFGLKEYLTRLAFGQKTADSADILNDAQRVSDIITERFADKLLRDLPTEERGRIKSVLPRLANWFIWGRLRNWWWQWILAIFVSLGGITGTILLMNQNDLLKAQNLKIDDQTTLLKSQTEVAKRQMLLEEASRRSNLVVLMSNIMDKVDREIEAQQSKGFSRKTSGKSHYTLSQSLIGQIAALSHSFKPYRYLSGDTLIPIPLSPERGEMLITLSLLPLDTATFNRIFESATFASAALDNAILTNAYLGGVYLRGADLREADLKGADLHQADLRGAYLYGVKLHKADLREAFLREAVLIEADLSGADLSKASLEAAYLNSANLEEACLNEAVLGGAVLSGAVLNGVDFHLTNLNGADLSGAVLFRADLSYVDLSYANLNAANMINANLRGVDLTKADLRSTYLTGANFDGADLSRASLRHTDLRETNVTVYQILQTKDMDSSTIVSDSVKMMYLNVYLELFSAPGN